MSTRTTVKELEAQVVALTTRLDKASRYAAAQHKRIAYIEDYLRAQCKANKPKRKAA